MNPNACVCFFCSIRQKIPRDLSIPETNLNEEKNRNVILPIRTNPKEQKNKIDEMEELFKICDDRSDLDVMNSTRFDTELGIFFLFFFLVFHSHLTNVIWLV